MTKNKISVARKLKNIIIDVNWGDRYPARHFFKAVSFEELERSEMYAAAMSIYPADTEMIIHPNVDEKEFNEALMAAKRFQKAIDKRNAILEEVYKSVMSESAQNSGLYSVVDVGDLTTLIIANPQTSNEKQEQKTN